MAGYAFITGASKGIGKAIAYELAARGKSLLLIARSEELLHDLCRDITKKYSVQVDYLVVDLSQATALDTIEQWLVAKSYTVDILVNNAGYGLSGSFDLYTTNDYQAMMQVNMLVPVALTRLLLPQLKQSPQAYILNIVSSAAYQAVPGLSVYAASKAFMLSFSRALQYELRKTNIAVTAVSPGSTDTQFAHRANVSSKALKTAERVNMTPEAVARLAVRAMFARKTEYVAGLINQIGAFLVWLFPKKIAEKAAANIYDI